MRITVERLIMKVGQTVDTLLHVHKPPITCQDVLVELEVSGEIFQFEKTAFLLPASHLYSRLIPYSGVSLGQQYTPTVSEGKGR